MKLKMKQGRTPSKSAVTIDEGNFAGQFTYVGRKIPTAKIRSLCVGLEVPAKLEEEGFLVVHGDKPGILVSPCVWDGKDRVKVTTERGKETFLSLDAYNASGHKKFKAEVLTAKEVVALAKKTSKTIEISRRSDSEKFQVALLNPMTDQYFAGVTAEGNELRVVNMEHVAPHNKKRVQFIDPKDIAAKPIFAALAKAA